MDKKDFIKNTVIIIFFIVLIVGGFGLFGSLLFEKAEISNFEECKNAGYSVTESNPFECRTPEGKVFVQDISKSPGKETGHPKYRSIRLYYYNSQKDPQQECSESAVLHVERNISFSQTPIRDSINLLLEGKISNKEKSLGFTTEFPLEGFILKGANLRGGVLSLEFTDPLNKTSGGSCRVGLLWAQIEKTAKQFPEVKQVRFIPPELFQP